MGENTKIEWAHHTFNPWIGCTKVGPGCDHCYAERDMDHRWGRVKWGPGNPRQRTSHANWQKPLQWNRQAEKAGTRFRVFCASLADVFDNEVPAQWRSDLFGLIEVTPHLDWMLLTKRIGNVRAMLPTAWLDNPVPNVWLGITVVNQEEADRDIPKLLDIPAAVRWLSMEPLLGPVDIERWLQRGDADLRATDPMAAALLSQGEEDGMAWVRPALDWVVTGGESGPNARPSHPDWFRSLRDQCANAGVPFLFKQWGEWLGVDAGWVCDNARDVHFWPFPDEKNEGPRSYLIGKKRAGRTLDGQIHDGFPEVRS